MKTLHTSSGEIDHLARAIPEEERPVPPSRWAGLGSFLGIYGGEHIAATEFVIGALLVTWGVKAGELIFGLVIGNLLASSSYALVTAPIAVDTRLTLFAYLRKVTGPWFQRAYNATWGLISIAWAASMMAISATSLKEIFSLPVQLAWYPTSSGCVVLTLALVAVTVAVAAYGFEGVVKFSSLCVPWMVAIFFCGAAVAVPLLCARTGFPQVHGPGDLMRLLETHVFNGAVPDGATRLTWIHVAAFAWICGFVYHVGLNDMSIFRFARKRRYGWVGLYGMFLGHFFAWICAGLMGAAAAASLGVGLQEMDSGSVAGSVLGLSGLAAVIVAGWTTATPNIYRASLSFATFFPRWSLRRIAFLVGVLIAIAACFPAVMRIDMIASYAALLVPPVGAICLTEHWLFPRIGLVRHWNLYRGGKVNPAALSAWLVAATFAVAGVLGNWMHPFFLPVPTFLVAGLVYPILAALMGARKAVPADVRHDVDAVEARLVELAEESTDRNQGEASRSRRKGRLFATLAIVLLVGAAVLASCGILPTEHFQKLAVLLTVLYFTGAIISDSNGDRRRRVMGSSVNAGTDAHQE